METVNWEKIEVAKKAALEVLMHNSHGPYNDLPRTAGGISRTIHKRFDVFCIGNCCIQQ